MSLGKSTLQIFAKILADKLCLLGVFRSSLNSRTRIKTLAKDTIEANVGPLTPVHSLLLELTVNDLEVEILWQRYSCCS
jgi:hypothetical protein